MRVISPELPLPIEDYAIIGDCTTSALVGLNGSIDWLCWPRFDSSACFAALLGNADHGRWKIAPTAQAEASRTYQGDSLVLQTRFVTAQGEVRLTDFMVMHEGGAQAGPSSVVRLVEGVRGRVEMSMDLALRFEYGIAVPWVGRTDEAGYGIVAIAGPDLVALDSSVPMHGEGLRTQAVFEVAQGESVSFVLRHGESHLPHPPAIDPRKALHTTQAYWREWIARCTYDGPYRDVVRRSLITLKALTFAPTGGIVAAATTSLPEQFGGTRNWDYRYCWLRDATLVLTALMKVGYYEEATQWRDWLHRAVAGSPSQLQIMYGLGGERRLTEWDVTWLPGYHGASPVRIGNAAAGQLQLDVYGEVMDTMHRARQGGLVPPEAGWDLQCAMMTCLEDVWEQPDEGIWEIRGERRHFTFSKVMAWLAFDRMVADAERYGLPGPVAHWRALRDRIHDRICREGYNTDLGCFTQSFGCSELDASLLMIPMLGFLPPDDPRILGTVAAIERDLLVDGFVLRYRTQSNVDGLPPGEGAFLACSYWLADVYALVGRHEDARALFERLLTLPNDVGLLAEEYDPLARRFLGNFPQAFSHVAMLVTALTLSSTP